MRTFFLALLTALFACGPAFAEPAKAVETVKAEHRVCERNEDCVLTKTSAVNKKYAKEYEAAVPQPNKPFGDDFTVCLDKKCVVGIHH